MNGRKETKAEEEVEELRLRRRWRSCLVSSVVLSGGEEGEEG